MSHRLRVGQGFTYQGRALRDLRGQSGIVLEVLAPDLLLVAFDLPDGRKPVLKVPPEDVGVTEEEAARFLHPDHPWHP